MPQCCWLLHSWGFSPSLPWQLLQLPQWFRVLGLLSQPAMAATAITTMVHSPGASLPACHDSYCNYHNGSESWGFSPSLPWQLLQLPQWFRVLGLLSQPAMAATAITTMVHSPGASLPACHGSYCNYHNGSESWGFSPSLPWQLLQLPQWFRVLGLLSQPAMAATAITTMVQSPGASLPACHGSYCNYHNGSESWGFSPSLPWQLLQLPQWFRVLGLLSQPAMAATAITTMVQSPGASLPACHGSYCNYHNGSQSWGFSPSLPWQLLQLPQWFRVLGLLSQPAMTATAITTMVQSPGASLPACHGSYCNYHNGSESWGFSPSLPWQLLQLPQWFTVLGLLSQPAMTATAITTMVHSPGASLPACHGSYCNYHNGSESWGFSPSLPWQLLQLPQWFRVLGLLSQPAMAATAITTMVQSPGASLPACHDSYCNYHNGSESWGFSPSLPWQLLQLPQWFRVLGLLSQPAMTATAITTMVHSPGASLPACHGSYCNYHNGSESWGFSPSLPWQLLQLPQWFRVLGLLSQPAMTATAITTMVQSPGASLPACHGSYCNYHNGSESWGFSPSLPWQLLQLPQWFRVLGLLSQPAMAATAITTMVQSPGASLPACHDSYCNYHNGSESWGFSPSLPWQLLQLPQWFRVLGLLSQPAMTATAITTMVHSPGASLPACHGSYCNYHNGSESWGFSPSLPWQLLQLPQWFRVLGLLSQPAMTATAITTMVQSPGASLPACHGSYCNYHNGSESWGFSPSLPWQLLQLPQWFTVLGLLSQPAMAATAITTMVQSPGASLPACHGSYCNYHNGSQSWGFSPSLPWQLLQLPQWFRVLGLLSQPAMTATAITTMVHSPGASLPACHGSYCNYHNGSESWGFSPSLPWQLLQLPQWFRVLGLLSQPAMAATAITTMVHSPGASLPACHDSNCNYHNGSESWGFSPSLPWQLLQLPQWFRVLGLLSQPAMAATAITTMVQSPGASLPACHGSYCNYHNGSQSWGFSPSLPWQLLQLPQWFRVLGLLSQPAMTATAITTMVHSPGASLPACHGSYCNYHNGSESWGFSPSLPWQLLQLPQWFTVLGLLSQPAMTATAITTMVQSPGASLPACHGSYCNYHNGSESWGFSPSLPWQLLQLPQWFRVLGLLSQPAMAATAITTMVQSPGASLPACHDSYCNYHNGSESWGFSPSLPWQLLQLPQWFTVGSTGNHTAHSFVCFVTLRRHLYDVYSDKFWILHAWFTVMQMIYCFRMSCLWGNMAGTEVRLFVFVFTSSLTVGGGWELF